MNCAERAPPGTLTCTVKAGVDVPTRTEVGALINETVGFWVGGMIDPPELPLSPQAASPVAKRLVAKTVKAARCILLFLTKKDLDPIRIGCLEWLDSKTLPVATVREKMRNYANIHRSLRAVYHPALEQQQAPQQQRHHRDKTGHNHLSWQGIAGVKLDQTQQLPIPGLCSQEVDNPG